MYHVHMFLDIYVYVYTYTDYKIFGASTSIQVLEVPSGPARAMAWLQRCCPQKWGTKKMSTFGKYINFFGEKKFLWNQPPTQDFLITTRIL